MDKNQRKSKSIQLGLRLDNDMLEEIQRLSVWEGIDKITWIKRTISDKIRDKMGEMADEIKEDYIKSRMDDQAYLELMHLKKRGKEETIGKIFE